MAITVTAPVGGAKWRKGTTKEIIWVDTVPESFVHIELWKGGIFDSLIKGKQAGTPQTYDWAIPGGQASGDDYQVKVEQWLTGTPNDLSDIFSIFEDFSRSLSDSIGLADSGTDARGIKTIKFDSLSLADILIRLKITGLSDIITLSDSDLFLLTKVLSDSVSVSDVIIKLLNRPLSDSISLADAIIRGKLKSLSDTISLGDADLFLLTKVLSDSVSVSDVIAKLLNRPLSDSISLSDAITRGKSRQLSDTISLGDALVLDIIKLLPETMNITDALLRKMSRFLSDTLSLADSIVATVVSRYVHFEKTGNPYNLIFITSELTPIHRPIAPNQQIGYTGGGATKVMNYGAKEQWYEIRIKGLSEAIKTQVLNFFADATVNYRKNTWDYWPSAGGAIKTVNLWNVQVGIPQVKGGLFNMNIIVRESI